MNHAGLLGALSAGGVASDIGRGLAEGAEMLWETLWALVLGVTLSGAVQAYASREGMQRHLGNHRPAAVARASLYGMASSSCSYAASAVARSLVVQGADFLAAMVFMFASTNLVIELGIVLVVLIGWQFLAAELVGAAVMIALLVLAGALWLRGASLEATRRRALAGAGEVCGGSVHPEPSRQQIVTATGWADAARYSLGDLWMLRRELVIGFGAAGVLSVLVPAPAWNELFLHGHGFWTNLENVLVGPLVAIVSCVCSVGNIPLAAALWKGGISFGGVVSFVFADLIALPLLLVYRRQYGARTALRMLALFWTVMSGAGLATGYLFNALGWVPTRRPAIIAAGSFGLDATSALDAVALAWLGLLAWLSRDRDRLGAGHSYAKDPVCGMQVEIAQAPESLAWSGTAVYFCSARCRDRFAREAETATFR